jgi:hypothetical protein
VSLLQDQRSIEELRQNIPLEVRQDNDLTQQILVLTGEVQLPPNQVRDRFQQAVQRQRSDHSRRQRKERDAFNQDERRQREQFLKTQNLTRKRDRPNPKNRDRTRDFFNELESARKDFQAQQKNKRFDFESKLKQVDEDFRASLRQKTADFEIAYKDYALRYEEQRRQRDQRLKAGGP